MAAPIKYIEVHSGDKHAQKTRERIQTDDAEGVVIRTMPTICLASTWEHQQGYDGAVKTVVSFVWSDTRGLREMWYSNNVGGQHESLLSMRSQGVRTL